MLANAKGSAEAAIVSSSQDKCTNERDKALKLGTSEVADLLPVYTALSRLPSVLGWRVRRSVDGYSWQYTADDRALLGSSACWDRSRQWYRIVASTEQVCAFRRAGPWSLWSLRVPVARYSFCYLMGKRWTAADQRRALLLGIGIAASFLAATLFVQLLLGQIAAAAPETLAREIADTLVGLARASLVAVLIVVAIAGALVAFGAYLAGQPEWLVWRLPTVASAGGAEPAEPSSRGS